MKGYKRAVLRAEVMFKNFKHYFRPGQDLMR